MRKQFLEAGKIINTHGIRGEVKIDPWTDAPEFFRKIKTLYIDGSPVKIVSARVHKSFVIASLEGVADMDSALRLKNKLVFINRDDVPLEDGAFFLQDLIGLKALDFETGDEIGTLTDIMENPAGNIYVIKAEREILVPANGPFVKEIDIDGGYIKLTLLEGM